MGKLIALFEDFWYFHSGGSQFSMWNFFFNAKQECSESPHPLRLRKALSPGAGTLPTSTAPRGVLSARFPSSPMQTPQIPPVALCSFSRKHRVLRSQWTVSSWPAWLREPRRVWSAALGPPGAHSWHRLDLGPQVWTVPAHTGVLFRLPHLKSLCPRHT